MAYIIGEIGQNHNGSVDIAKEIIDIVIHSGNNIHPDNVYGYGVPDFQKAYNNGKR